VAIETFAATLTVTNTNDSGAGSLRQVLASANPAGGDTIVFNIPTSDPGYNFGSGVYTINTGSELVVNRSLTITGLGARRLIVRRSANSDRIFNVSAGNVAVTISGMTIANGLRPNGAGIYNFLTALTVRDCSITGNVDPITTGNGGGIFNDRGSLNLQNCTFSGNGSSLHGGAVANGSGDAQSVLTMTNCTLSNNTASSGGGVYHSSSASATITNCTIVNNLAGNLGGGIFVNGPMSVRNSIIAGNTVVGGGQGPDCSGAVTSAGYNLVGNGTNSSGFTATGDQIGTDASPISPGLGALANNGGNTDTMQPLPGSRVIDKGGSGGPSTDQRGVTRPLDNTAVPPASGGDNSDIGACERDLPQTAGVGGTLLITSLGEYSDGICGVSDCTLPEALDVSNGITGGSKTIVFEPGLSGTISNRLIPGGLNITAPVEIRGPGARTLTVSGENLNRVFRVFNIPSGQEVILSGLTIAGGYLMGNGAGIYNSSNGSTLSVIDCTLRDNGLTFGDGGGAFNDSGGTIYFYGCTFSGNYASQGGGALRNNGAAYLTNCTLSNNSSGQGGGALFNADAMAITNCTVATNSTTNLDGGGIVNIGTTVNVANSLFAFNTSPVGGQDCSGTFTSQGHNLIRNGDGASGFNGVGDQVGTGFNPISPNIGPLQHNGGPTDTRALLFGSPAINAGDNAFAPAIDQRRFSRNGTSDIGAFEFNGIPPPVSLTSAALRKTHGSGVFDINLPLTGNVGVECRNGGASNNHKMIFRFSNTLASVGGATVTSGVGMVSGSAIGADQHEYVVDLTGIANAQRITVRLSNVTDSLGYNSSTVSASAGFLLGDTTGNGSVNASDVSQTKSKSGQAVSASNFRTDVTISNSINSSDVSLVKSKSGTALP
jgi:hypothetical protein